MNQQVGNADTAPESENIQPDVDFDSDDFFESLDNSVNAGILDEPSQSTSNQSSGNTQSSPSEVQQQSDGSDTDVLQKRYSDSSREAKG